MNLDELAQDIVQALNAANSEADGADGGTCNMDSLFLNIGADCMLPGKAKALEKSLAGHRIGCIYHRGKLRRGYLITPPIGSQASRRTAVVEIALEKLRTKYKDMSIWYQVD